MAHRIASGCVLMPVAFLSDLEAPLVVFEDPGGRFGHELKQAFRNDLGAWLNFSIQAAGALADLHDHGIVHKELRPENMFVEERVVRLSGLGAASLPHEEPRTELRTEMLLDGHIAYISPEHTGRTSRNIDQRSDLYSLGVVLYELLTGRLPLNGADLLEWSHRHIATVPLAPVKRITGLPEPVSAIVMKLLAKLPEDRYQTARGLKHDLEQGSLREEGLRGFAASWRIAFPQGIQRGGRNR